MTFGRQRDRDASPTLVRRDALGLCALLLLLLWLAPALSRAQGADSLVLSWTAPGDDGMTGRAALYDLRSSVVPMTAANFPSGLTVPGTPSPEPAGTHESLVVRGLVRGTTYWFGLRTRDEAGNWSGISNIARFDWPPDAAPPAAPSGVTAALLAGSSTVRVSWSPNSEPDLAGYRAYRATASGGPWQRVASVGSGIEAWSDGQLPAGADELWYAVSAFDRSGGEGARSAMVQVALQAGLPGVPLAWDIQPAYPNPARVGGVMRIPIAVPANVGAAHLDLLDGAGRRVRRFDLGGSPAGISELEWDGMNDAGGLCAPGVYRAVLEAPGILRSIVVARIP